MTPPDRQYQLIRLQQAMVMLRWLVAGVVWLIVLVWIALVLPHEVSLLRDHFTWVGLRYAIADHFWFALMLSLAVGLTTSVLVWQSRNILFGLPDREKYRLEQLLTKIEERGRRHPLWFWVHRESPP